MRVLLIDVVCKYGSTGKIAYETYSYLNAHGSQAAICYGRGPKIKENNVFKFGLDWETFLHAFLTRATGFTGCYSFFSTRRLIRFIKQFKPDVVHLHELHAYFLNLSQLLSFLKKQSIRVIHTLHCAFSYTGKCGHHLDCEGWKNNCGNCPRLKDYISTLWFDHTKRMFLKKKKAFEGFRDLTIVCPSEWLANYAKQSFLKQYPIKVIHNGINVSVFHPVDSRVLRNKLKISTDEIVILAVAPDLMSNAKGGDWILKLAELLKGEKYKVIMVGVESKVIDPPENVLLFNKTNNQTELAEFYSLADVFVICSEMENFPTTCLEAQCCGTPVCGFDVGGVKETSVLGTNSFVQYGSINQLLTVVRGFNQKTLESSTTISTKAIECFSMDVANKTIMDLYMSNKNSVS